MTIERWVPRAKPDKSHLAPLIAVFALTSLSGCMTEVEAAKECPEYPSDDRQEVYQHVRDRWHAADDEEGHLLGVLALRTSPPDPPQDDNDTYVVWSKIREDRRPDYFFDILCLSLWRQENIETLTSSPYWTLGNPNTSVGEHAMGHLQEEYERQNGSKNEEGWVFLLFRDQWFVASYQEVEKIN